MTPPPPPPRLALLLAFAAVYVIWGSTYLAIRVAIETLPPCLMAGARFLGAGGLLYAWARARGAPRPTRRNWRAAVVVGALLLLLGNGLVVWSESRVPSGIAALLVAIVPLWIVGLTAVAERRWPPVLIMAGVALGLVGLALLVHGDADSAGVDLLAVGGLLVSTLSWALGSLYSRKAPQAASPILATGMQMLCGGALLTVAGVATGEPARVDLAHASVASWIAVAYLLVFGSLVGYSAYTWLLRVASPAAVSTYAYVNPVVAMVLGWAFAREAITPRMVMASLIIIAAVVLITRSAARPRT